MYNIFISVMAYDHGESGISDYINNVVSELSKENNLDLLILREDLPNFPIRNDNIRFITISDRLAKPIINMLWHLFILPFRYNFKKYDFIFLPAGNRRILAYYPIFTITTFHDLSQFHIKNKYDSFRMIYIKKVIPFFLKKVNKIIAVGNATKNDLIKFYHCEEDKITVAYNGYDSNKFNKIPSSKSRVEILKSDKKYILYVARIEHPGKNHLNLIKAYELLPEAIKTEYNLVCVGGFKERSEEVLEYKEKSKDSDKIIFTGYFPSEDLTDLYKLASLFVMPSFFEGFGIPLVEAMACNIPVISSDRGPLPEVVGEAALLFDPDFPEEIAEKIKIVLSNDEMKKELIDKGNGRLEKFQWSLHCKKILHLFKGKNNDL